MVDWILLPQPLQPLALLTPDNGDEDEEDGIGNGIAEEGVNEEDNIGGGVGVKLWERRACNEKGAGPPGENIDEGWYEDDSGWDGKGSLARSGSQLKGVVDADDV